MAYRPDYIAIKTMGQTLQDRRQEVHARRWTKYFAQMGKVRSRFFSGTLVWLGSQLVGWGSSLEGRCGPCPGDASAGLLVES